MLFALVAALCVRTAQLRARGPALDAACPVGDLLGGAQKQSDATLVSCQQAYETVLRVNVPLRIRAREHLAWLIPGWADADTRYNKART